MLKKGMIVLACAMALSMTAGTAISTAACAAESPYVYAGVGKDRTPWFIRHEEGVKQGAKENGGEGVYSAAPTADEAQQVRIIEDFIAKGVNALLVVPNNAKSLEPSFKKARDKGIAVVTQESPHQVNADFDVEMLDNTKFGELMMDEMVKYSKGKAGSYAIYVGSLTVPAHNHWADAAIARQKAKYPNLKFINKFPVSEDRNASRQTALDLLKTYPDLVGIICMGSEGAPGVAKALKEKKLRDKIVVLGVTTPNVGRKDIKDGYITEGLLWDPAQAARVQAYVAKTVLDGKASEIKDGFEVPGFGKPVIDGNTLIFDQPLQVTKENVDKLHF
ncbi:MAG: substrate-binding domain-containing protein [Succinivibrio sp.]|jgi:simple sugar transport system substrate-binding protein|nr:substrate-binding domain-containing protein [Succinivibrio sp.]